MIVVDNQSKESSVSELCSIENENRVKIIFEQTNLGYFGGLNAGIKWARARQIDFTSISG